MVGPVLPREPGAGVGGVRSEPCQPRLGTLAQCRPGAGVLGCPLLWRGLTGTVSWEEPRLGLFPYRKLEKRGVEVPAHSNHPQPPTITGLSVVFCLCALGIISTQCPSCRARHLGLALPCLNHPFTSPPRGLPIHRVSQVKLLSYSGWGQEPPGALCPPKPSNPTPPAWFSGAHRVAPCHTPWPGLSTGLARTGAHEGLVSCAEQRRGAVWGGRGAG